MGHRMDDRNGHGIASTLSHPHHPSSPERYPFDIQSWDLSKLRMSFKKKGILKHHGRMNKIHQQHSSTTNSQEKTAVKPQAKRKVFQAIRPGKWAIPKRNSHNHPFCRCERLVSRSCKIHKDLSQSFRVFQTLNTNTFFNLTRSVFVNTICGSEILKFYSP